MADKKISALTALLGADVADGDLFVVDDVSATETKGMTAAEARIAIVTAARVLAALGNYIVIPGSLESPGAFVVNENGGGTGKTFYGDHGIGSLGEGAVSYAAFALAALTHTFKTGSAGDVDALVLNADGTASFPQGIAGMPRVIGPIVINFDDAGLVAGKDIYTPIVGDVLLNAWINVIEAWDGTTPSASVGTLVDATYGLVDTDLTQVYREFSGDDGGGLGVAFQPPNGLLFTQLAIFVAPNPLKICISDTGATDGADPGATQGVAHVYLVVATPVAP